MLRLHCSGCRGAGLQWAGGASHPMPDPPPVASVIVMLMVEVWHGATPDWTEPLDWALALLGKSLYSTKLLSSSSVPSEANEPSACRMMRTG